MHNCQCDHKKEQPTVISNSVITDLIARVFDEKKGKRLCLHGTHLDEEGLLYLLTLLKDEIKEIVDENMPEPVEFPDFIIADALSDEAVIFEENTLKFRMADGSYLVVPLGSATAELDYATTADIDKMFDDIL